MITTLSGTNSYALRTELDRRTRDFVKEFGDMALEKIDADEAEYAKITEAMNSLPFLASKKMVVLDRPGTQKAFTENFAQLIESISDSTDVIIVEPKPDKRSTYYKQLQKKTEFKNFDELDRKELPKWLGDRAKAAGGSLSAQDAAYLIDRVGSNQQLLANEIDKLLAYDSEITRAKIDLLTEAEPASTVFQLLDAAFAGHQQQALKLYREQRAQRVEPLAILAMLAWQLHVLAVVKAAGDRTAAEIARDAKLNPYVVQKSQSIARRISAGRLKELIHALSALDMRFKSSAIDPDEALQYFLLSLGE